MNYYLDALKKYIDFEGRATRKEFWMFVLINILVVILLSVIDGLLWLNGILTWLYFLALFLPNISITARRLHDIGKSWWWQLITFIPFIGWIWLLVLLVLDSDCDNKYWANKYSKKCDENQKTEEL